MIFSNETNIWIILNANDVIGLVMLVEGEPKPHRRQSGSVCGAPVARFGVWVGPWNGRRRCCGIALVGELAGALEIVATHCGRDDWS